MILDVSTPIKVVHCYCHLKIYYKTKQKKTELKKKFPKNKRNTLNLGKRRIAVS